MSDNWMGINETYSYYRIRHKDGEERVLVAGIKGVRQSCRRYLKDGVKTVDILDDDGKFLFSVEKAIPKTCKHNSKK